MQFPIEQDDAVRLCAEAWPRARMTALHTGATIFHITRASDTLLPVWGLIAMLGLWHYCRIICYLPDVTERAIVWRYVSATALLVVAIAVGVAMRFSA